jgi:lipopolysaccharide transport system permease protein
MDIRLVWELTKRDFVERYSGSVLGLVWEFIWPLVTMSVYIVIFSKVMGAKLPGSHYTHGYGVYLIAGLVPWLAFSRTIARTSTLFVDKKALITKIRVSLPVFPLFVILSESITFAISIGLYVVFLLVSDVGIHWLVIFLPFIYLAQQILAYALGFLVATLQVFIRDLKEIVGIVIFVWFWLNPIVYVPEILPASVQSALLFNPSFWFIDAYQKIFVYQQAPNFNYLIVLVVIGHVILAGAYFIFKKLERDLRDFL